MNEKLEEFILKLDHPLLEVQIRSLQSILQKLENEVCSVKDLLQYRSFIPNLIALLKSDVVLHRIHSINLLRLLLKDREAQITFKSQDGEKVLQKIAIELPVQYEKDVYVLLEMLNSKCKEISSTSGEQHTFDAENVEEAYVLNASNNQSSTSCGNSLINGYGPFGDSTLNAQEFHNIQNPILFLTFPWVPLTSVDLKVLDSAGQSVANATEAVFPFILFDCQNVLFKDYPIEIFLQRPFILKVLLGYLITNSTEKNDNWRQQEMVCSVIGTFMAHLFSRIKDYELAYKNQELSNVLSKDSFNDQTDSSRPLSCCFNSFSRSLAKQSLSKGELSQPSVETLHESDDSNEFIVLKIHQLTIVDWCCQLLLRLFELLKSPHFRLVSCVVHSSILTMKILRGCLSPQALWDIMANAPDELEQRDFLQKISSSLLQGLSILSRSLVSLYEDLRQQPSSGDIENLINKIRNVRKVFLYWIDIFSPSKEFDMVFGKHEIEAFNHLLSDPFFYIVSPRGYENILFILNMMQEPIYTQAKALYDAVGFLRCTKDFLEVSSSNVEYFHEKAVSSLQLLLLHKSRVFIEKIVRGLAKQIGGGGLPEIHASKGRQILLMVLSNPDTYSRVLGYHAVKKLVIESVGISQAGVTSMCRSRKVLIILHPRILRHLIYFGCYDSKKEVSEESRICLLSLLRGNHLMEDNVLQYAFDMYKRCLLDIQNLVDSDTRLGRAVLNLPYELSKQLSDEMHPLRVKFYVKCLLSKDGQIRQESLRNCLAILITSGGDFISVSSMNVDVERDCDLFALVSVTDIFQLYPTNVQDRNNLSKILNVLSSGKLDKDLLEASWMQLTFILRNPALHSELDIIWPVSECISALTTMLKVDGGGGYTVSLIPFALEVLRHRATFSSTSRKIMAENADLILLILRASLFFRSNDNVRVESAILFSLILNEDVIIEKRSSSGSSYGSLSVPYLVSKNLCIPFVHSCYNWPSEFPVTELVDILLAMEHEGKNLMFITPTNFLKNIWSYICTNDAKELVRLKFDFASSFSTHFILHHNEKIHFVYSLPVSYICKLLNDVENSTTFRVAKQSITNLRMLLVIVKHEPDELVKEILRLQGWSVALSRFFLRYPTTAAEKQILFHTTLLIIESLQMSASLFLKDQDCVFCPFITLLAKEFSKSESTLSVLLRETGSKDFSIPSSNPETIQSFLLLKSLLELITEIASLSSFWSCNCESVSIDWSSFTSNGLFILRDIIKKCKILPNYNLCALVPALQSLVVLLKNQKIGDISLSLIPLLIDLLMCVHVGRGRAHNTFLGRSVSTRCLLSISLIIGRLNETELGLKVINKVHEEIRDLPWLLSSLEHSDSSLVASGLKVVISLSSSLKGARVLDEAFMQVPGGIWTLLMRYLVREDLSPAVRILSGYALLNFTSHLFYCHNDDDKPWKSLCLTDTLAGVSDKISSETVVGEEALMGIIVLFDVFGRGRNLLKGIRSSVCDVKRHLLPNIEAEEYKEFLSSEESTWASSDAFEDVGSEDLLVNEFPELLLIFLKIFFNLLNINPSHVSKMFDYNDIGKILIRQFGLLSNDVISNDKWNLCLLSGFLLIRRIGKPFCSNTHLASLAINSFATDYPQSDSMKKECMKLLSCMVVEGGWGAVHVIELLRVNLSYIISFVIQCLHERAACNSSAAAFVGSLCQVVMGPVPPMYVSSLKEMLDSPLKILSRDKEVLPGWEIARHIIQLLPDKMDSSIAVTYLTKFDEDEGNVKIFLEALKNLLLVSKSARDCAFFRATDLLKLSSFSLSNLNERILDINLHISSNINNKKELRGDFLFATHCLQVSTNWVIEPCHQVDVPGNTLIVAECLIPLLHPLWIPALRAPLFIEAVVQFLIMISSHVEVCPVLTRTSVLPGALLSSTRTRNSLLVSITANVTRLLERKKAVSGSRCLTDCGTLPKSLLEDALDLLVNCGRVHDSAYVIVKEGFLKTLVTFLEQFKDLESTLAQKVLQCLTILTLHKEAHTALSKVPSWVRVVKICIQSKHLRKNALLILINMISNVAVVKHMLSTEDFLPVVGTLLINCSKDLTAGSSSLYTEADIHLCLVVLWALAANNQRCKTILKRLVIKPHLENLYQHHRHPSLSLKLLGILNS